MNTLRMLTTAGAIALILPMAMPNAGFAQHGRGGGHGGFAARGGAPAGGFAAGARSGAVAPSAGTVGVARGGGVNALGRGQNFAATAQYGGGHWQGGNWQGGNWRGGNWNGNRWGRGWYGGALAGAAIGSAFAAYPYYDDSYSYGDGYGYGDGDGYDVAAVPGPVGDDAVAYCQQRFRSYDPASGTYLGYDGQRHPCP